MFYFEPWIVRGKCQFTAYWRQSCSNLKRGCYVLSAFMILYYNYWFPASEHDEHCSHIQSLHVKISPWTQKPRAGLYNSSLKLNIVDDGLDSWQLSSIQLLMQNIICIYIYSLPVCKCHLTSWNSCWSCVSSYFSCGIHLLPGQWSAQDWGNTWNGEGAGILTGSASTFWILYVATSLLLCLLRVVLGLLRHTSSAFSFRHCVAVLHGGPLCVPRAPCRVKEQ